MKFVTSTQELKEAFKEKKFASMIGMEKLTENFIS
jgi:hypothetical protein